MLLDGFGVIFFCGQKYIVRRIHSRFLEKPIKLLQVLLRFGSLAATVKMTDAIKTGSLDGPAFVLLKILLSNDKYALLLELYSKL